jgi:hypothetical protein
MACAWQKIAVACIGWWFVVEAQPPIQFNQSGTVNRDGRKIAYLIRYLPVNSFPDLPVAVQAELNRRGCLFPQSYEARRPENVIHGSFEKPGSSDWAVLCSAGGKVSLLVFFAGAPEKPAELETFPEPARLQPHDLTGALGFNWGIDTATPGQVRDAQAGMTPRPPPLDHDAIADVEVDHRTRYRYFAKGGWTLVDLPE